MNILTLIWAAGWIAVGMVVVDMTDNTFLAMAVIIGGAIGIPWVASLLS